jgi:hypothetical protein
MRKTLREIYAETQKSLDTLSALTGKPRILVPVLPPKRTLRKPSNQASEAQTQKAILQYLAHHPKVARVWRQNSGTFRERNRDGSFRYIRANTARGMADIMGVLTDGRTLAIEVKSATGRVSPDQAAFLESIASAGGIAGVCRSIDDAAALLEKS